MEDVKKWLEMYERTSKANSYCVYFTYRHIVYRIELESLQSYDIVKIGVDSKNKGGNKKLVMYVSSKIKQMWILEGKAKKIFPEVELLEGCKRLGINKGQYVEYLESKRIGKQYKLDNREYSISGDIRTPEGQEIQVKYENASVAYLSTITKNFKRLTNN